MPQAGPGPMNECLDPVLANYHGETEKKLKLGQWFRF
jgi:hypothetical protein